MIARILLGFVFVGAGVAGLMSVNSPPPPNLPEKLQAFLTGIMATGYFFYLLKVTEIICGLLLLAGVFVPLALIILAPIILNIFLLHLFVAPDGLVLAVVIGALEIYLAFFASPYKEVLRPIFRIKPSLQA
jgi:uncharacterized membrane protein YphA (DoxX/SURF4 family)